MKDDALLTHFNIASTSLFSEVLYQPSGSREHADTARGRQTRQKAQRLFTLPVIPFLINVALTFAMVQLPITGSPSPDSLNTGLFCVCLLHYPPFLWWTIVYP